LSQLEWNVVRFRFDDEMASRVCVVVVVVVLVVVVMWW